MYYLCGMKAAKTLFITLCTILLSMPLHAQFNTIGTYQHKRIKTTNPPKPVEALTDSIVLADSLSEPAYLESGGNIQTHDFMVGNTDSVPFVSLPLRSIHISSRFGMRMHPIYHKWMMHNGVDLSARYESVFSMFPGTVIRVGQDNRSGKFVTVKTGDYTISYCHLSQQYVKVNDFVNAGTIIACSGNTGKSRGPHLHLSAKKNGNAFDAAILLDYICVTQSKQ